MNLGAWLGAMWEFFARWFTRPPGDGSMRGAAFVRYAGADGLGHVGWAFDYDAADVNAGSVENPSGAPSSDPADMGYWDVFVPSPIPAMAEKAPVRARMSRRSSAEVHGSSSGCCALRVSMAIN